MKRSANLLLVLGVALLVVVAAVVVVGATRSTATWRIGLEAPLSGSQSALGQGMLKGAQLAANEVNAAGGVLGRNLEIVPINDAADPTTAVKAAKAAISSKLDGVVGPYNSSVGVKTLPLYDAAGLVPIRLTSASATEGMGVTLQPMESQIAPVATNAISGWLGAKSVAIAYDDTSAYTKGVAATVRDALSAKGVTITAYQAVKPGQSDYTAQVSSLLLAKPDTVYAAVYYPEAGLMAKAIVASGTSSTCLMDYAAYDSAYVSAAGTAATHCPVLGVPAPSDFAGSGAHIAEYRATFGSAPSTWSPYTYDSVKLLGNAATRAGGFGAAKLMSALDATKGWRGWTGPATIEAKTGNRIPASVVVTNVDRGGSLHLDGAWAASSVGAAATNRSAVRLNAELDSQGTTTHQINGGSVLYGRNLLMGSAEISGGVVDVEMIGNVDYTNGSGPFFGFVTFTWPDGTILSTTMDGAAQPTTDGSTSFAASLTIIGGTGRYADATGSGSFRGSRSGTVGSPVTSTFVLNPS
jgi:ABC-type branched-subunit amino acid transport system substrate-binding protein